MAISRQKKEQIVADLSTALESSKMTVYAKYSGLTVAEAQELRTLAKEGGSVVKVVKNRLIKVAAKQTSNMQNTDLSDLSGQLMYVFNSNDEVAPAQLLAQYAKKHPSIELTGAINAAGQLINREEVNYLANLPKKDVLIGQLVGTIAAPLSGFVNVMSGNLRGLVNVLKAREEVIS